MWTGRVRRTSLPLTFSYKVAARAFDIQVNEGIERKTTLMLFSNIPYLTKNILYGNRLWQRGYFVDSVEIKGEVIQRYV